MALTRVSTGSVADRGQLAIDPLVYAEVSVGFERVEDLEEALPAPICRG